MTHAWSIPWCWWARGSCGMVGLLASLYSVQRSIAHLWMSSCAWVLDEAWVLLRSLQRAHDTIANLHLSFSSSFARICVVSVLKFPNFALWFQVHLSRAQMCVSPLQSQAAWSISSTPSSQRSQLTSRITFRFHRFNFVGSDSEQARHIKFFTLVGTRRDHTLVHKDFWAKLLEGPGCVFSSA